MKQTTLKALLDLTFTKMGRNLPIEPLNYLIDVSDEFYQEYGNYEGLHEDVFVDEFKIKCNKETFKQLYHAITTVDPKADISLEYGDEFITDINHLSVLDNVDTENLELGYFTNTILDGAQVLKEASELLDMTIETTIYLSSLLQGEIHMSFKDGIILSSTGSIELYSTSIDAFLGALSALSEIVSELVTDDLLTQYGIKLFYDDEAFQTYDFRVTQSGVSMLNAMKYSNDYSFYDNENDAKQMILKYPKLMQKAPKLFWNDRSFVIEYIKKNYSLLEEVNKIERDNSGEKLILPSIVKYILTKHILIDFDDDHIKPELLQYKDDLEMMQILLETMYYWIPLSESFLLSVQSLDYFDKKPSLLVIALYHLDDHHLEDHIEKKIDENLTLKLRYSVYKLGEHLRQSPNFIKYLQLMSSQPEFSKDIATYIRSLDEALKEQVIKENATFIASIKNDIGPNHPLNNFAWDILPHTNEYFSDETLEVKKQH